MALASAIVKSGSRGNLFHNLQRNSTKFAVKNLNELTIKRSESQDLRTQKEITDYVTKEVGKVN